MKGRQDRVLKSKEINDVNGKKIILEYTGQSKVENKI